MPGIPGFDCSSFPGLTTAGWLRSHTNLQWCGFYLGPAPSHPGTDWMAHRKDLEAQSWGIAPLYVGQQVTGPGSKHPSLAQGKIDGQNAVGLMNSAGFNTGRFVYLDLENGAPFTDLQRDYVAGWVDAVQAGHFGAGVYCSHSFANQVHTLRSTARIWAFKVSTTAAHAFPGTNFPDSHPSGSGFAGAFAWQLSQNTQISVGGSAPHTLTVDLDTALTTDPGS
jgi:Domain of unknown function (DUF1906)